MSTSDSMSNNNRISRDRAACVSCHDRKIKCDAHKRGFPCSNCIASQRTNCRRHEKKRRPHVRSPGSFVPIRRWSQSEASPDSTTAESVAVSNTVQKPANVASHDGSDFGRHLVEFVDEKDIPHRSVLRGVRMTYLGKDVSNLNFLIRQREGAENRTVYHVSSDEIASQFNPHESDRIPREAFLLPEQDLADQLVQAYFTHINPGCPIVDEETFMSQYRRKDPIDPPSLLLLQAILLVGAHVSQQRPDRNQMKATFFRRAKMLFDGRLEQNRDFVVQAALLLTWHSNGREDVGANSWHWVGIAARTALGLGLHRDYGILDRSMHPDLHTWRRLWWILVQYDVTVALSYGRPQAINLDECDVKPLASTDFQGCGPNVQIDYVVKRTELCVLISKILRERFGLHVSKEDRKAALGSADEALANWCLKLPGSLQMCSSEMGVWSSSLHLTYSNFLILLHRPHPRADKGSEDYGPNDSDICSTAANTITNVFESLRSRDMIKFLWISDINALFTAMVQVSVELRFSNPVLAINALRRFDSSLVSLRKFAEYWINAESILRIFEESSHVQHGIRIGERVEEQDRSRNQQKDQFIISDTSQNDAVHLQTPEWSVDDLSDLNVLAAAADVARDSSTTTCNNYRQDTNTWKNLFPGSDSTMENYLLATDIPFDSEWREIYWQEPGISGSFGDGMWGWP